jgi:hypothetical protein
LPRGASVAEKEIGPPGMGSPIGKRRVMKEESSSSGRLFVVNYNGLQLHALLTGREKDIENLPYQDCPLTPYQFTIRKSSRHKEH